MTLSRIKLVAGQNNETESGDHISRTPQRVQIDLAKRKQLSLNSDAPDCLYVVEHGCLTLDATLPDERRQVMLILYPGEVISRSAVPPMQDIHLTAMLPSRVARIQLAHPGGSGGKPMAESAPTSAGIAHLLARSSLHALTIGRLTGEERLVALLIEMALFLGTTTAAGYIFELPLTHEDMADNLALNPDTLSRLLTRLKSRDLISLPTRHRIIIKNFTALAELTPVSDTLQRLRASVD